MTLEQKKEEFLKIQSYEEFERRRVEFKGLSVKDKEIREHLKVISPICENYMEQGAIYSVFPDGSKMLYGPGKRTIKEKGYKSVEDYYRRIKEESNN